MGSLIGTNWELQRLQLRLGEIAAALAVKNVCGGLFSRREYSNLLDAVEKHFEIRLNTLPPWLQGIYFNRTCTVLGEGMRRIPASKTFDDVDKGRLSGLATFVVLCTRLVENVKGVTELVHLLTIGALGNVVSPRNPDERPDLPYNFKTHLSTFVTSCIEADSSSEVSARAKTCISELYAYEDFTWRDGEITIRRRQATIELMSELFGGTPIDNEMSRLTGKPKKSRPGDDEWGHVHNTMHVACANIALAAAMNGADVVVQCMKASGNRYFPSLPPEADRKGYFLVRLWCCQPPDDVKGIMRFSSQNQTSTWQDVPESQDQQVVDDEDFIVYGGELEAARWISKSLANSCQMLESPREAMLELWRKGVEIGRGCRWTTKQQVNKLYPLRIQLVMPVVTRCRADEAKPIAKALCEKDNRLEPVADVVAGIVHEVYGLSDYATYMSRNTSEIIGAAQVVMAAIAVQSISNVVLSVDQSLHQYAFHLSSFVRGKDSILEFLASALCMSKGVSVQSLIWRANAIWGGGIYGSKGQPLVADNVIGIVSQNCTIILDMIRDPVNFLSAGLNGKFLSLWRGAACIVPRDPQSGYIRCLSKDPFLGRLDSSYEPSTLDPGARLNGRMFLTFEPHVQDATYGTFCYWYSGHLAAEISPMQVFLNLLRRPVKHLPEWDQNMPTPQEVAERVIMINQMDLLELARFDTEIDAVILVDGIEDPPWALFAAGCCPMNNTLVHDGTIEELSFDNIKSKMTCGEVIMIIPGCGSGAKALGALTNKQKMI